MKRTDFLKKLVHICLWGLLAWLSIILGRNATTDDRCISCPEYAGCNDKRKCKFNNPDLKG